MGISNSLVSVDQRMPFFDNNCVELIYSLPDEYRLNNRLYSTMLQQTFRKYFKDIPWQKTGKPAGVVGASSVSSRAFKKILRHLQSVMAIKSSKSYTNYKEWISSNEVVEALVKLLDPKDAFYAKFTQSDYLTECLSPHLKRPSVDNSRQILRLATVEIYMRQVKDHHQSL